MTTHPDEFLMEDDRPRSVSDPRIQTPSLIIMLGSTSAIAGLELMRHMLSLKPDDLRRVALVYIDTDDQPTAVVEFRRQHRAVPFQESQLRIAVPTGVSNAKRVPQCDEDRDILDDPNRISEILKTEQHTFIKEKVPQYFANGAGGIRNNGHVAGCFNYHLITNTLDLAVGRITRLGAKQDEVRSREVQVNIVAFLGGGTGSGMLTDVTVLARELLANRQFKQRINLFCILPEPIRGVSMTDLSWRKSNATAGLLELLAFSCAAAGTKNGVYEKYVRGKSHRLTNDAIANEVYLVGRSAMDDASDAARIVGIDLFQRITDASGVGFLEHSQWIDRRTLGGSDDRGLPTMFGTSCPLEVRFPADEMAATYARISTARLLPLIASYRPGIPKVGETEKREWAKKWREVARFEAGVNDPMAIKLPEFRQSEFEDASPGTLDTLWVKIERLDSEVEAHIREAIELKAQGELARVSDVSRSIGEGSSVLNRRIQYLQHLQQEYETVLDILKGQSAPPVPGRPVDLERKLTNSPRIVVNMRNYASAVAAKYNERVRVFARATRHRLLEQTTKDLSNHVAEALKQSLSWFQGTEADDRAKEIEASGYASMGWQSRLEHPHPHQRHLLDLRSLRALDGHSVAADRLYRAVTGGDADAPSIDFNEFVPRYIEYANRSSATSVDKEQELNSIESQLASRLVDRVEEFFFDYYTKKFETMNLFDLLDKAAPPPQKGVARSKQIGGYLLEHLKHIRGLMSGLVAFEAELWHEGSSMLDTSIYLGINLRDGNQRAIFEMALDDLGSITGHGQAPFVDSDIDPHRLEVSYGQHAISLSTVRDFYLDRNSAMEEYLMHQEEWLKSNGRGVMPVHTSGEAELLVTEPTALGYTDSRKQSVNLVDRVLRHAY